MAGEIGIGEESDSGGARSPGAEEGSDVGVDCVRSPDAEAASRGGESGVRSPAAEFCEGGELLVIKGTL